MKLRPSFIALILASTTLALRLPAAAQDAPPTLSAPTESPSAKPAANPLGFDWATVFDVGKPVPPGAWSRTIRPFYGWMQICDQIRNGKRICYLESVAKSSEANISFRVALAADGRSMALFVLPADSTPEAGLEVAFGTLSKVAKPLICDPSNCVATFPVDGPFVSLIARETQAKITFSRHNAPATTTIPLKGMDLALIDLNAATRGELAAKTADASSSRPIHHKRKTPGHPAQNSAPAAPTP